jgi:hypothetical protein
MVGERGDAIGPGLEQLDRACLGEGLLALGDDRAHAVAGDGVAHEDHVAVQARDAGAPVGEGVDGQLELLAALGARRRGGVHRPQRSSAEPLRGRQPSFFSIAPSTDLRLPWRRS